MGGDLQTTAPKFWDKVEPRNSSNQSLRVGNQQLKHILSAATIFSIFPYFEIRLDMVCPNERLGIETRTCFIWAKQLRKFIAAIISTVWVWFLTLYSSLMISSWFCFFTHVSTHQLRHKQSWEIVNSYVQRCLKVWSVKPEQSILPSILPWVEQCFEELTYVRTLSEEGIILWINLPTAGILSLMKKNFLISLVTGMLTATAGNSIAVLIHSTRAADTKTGSEPQVSLGYPHEENKIDMKVSIESPSLISVFGCETGRQRRKKRMKAKRTKMKLMVRKIKKMKAMLLMKLPWVQLLPPVPSATSSTQLKASCELRQSASWSKTSWCASTQTLCTATGKPSWKGWCWLPLISFIFLGPFLHIFYNKQFNSKD